MTCAGCGRKLTNDTTKPNAAAWTLRGDRVPYCADSDACRRVAEDDE